MLLSGSARGKKYEKPKNCDEDTDVDIREWQRNPFRYPLFYSMEMKAKHDSPFIRLKRNEHQEHFMHVLG